jgi:hypothetical protein
MCTLFSIKSNGEGQDSNHIIHSLLHLLWADTTCVAAADEVSTTLFTAALTSSEKGARLGADLAVGVRAPHGESKVDLFVAYL